ncbi:MAG: hypothetical protein ACK5LO_09430 [Leucobacter sp.]
MFMNPCAMTHTLAMVVALCAARIGLVGTSTVLAVSTIALTSCTSTSSLDGTYYNDAGRLTISRGEVVFNMLDCAREDGIVPNGQAEFESAPSAEGALAADESSIVWVSNNEHISFRERPVGGTTPISVAKSGDLTIIRIDGVELRSGDDETALAAFAPRCGVG